VCGYVLIWGEFRSNIQSLSGCYYSNLYILIFNMEITCATSLLPRADSNFDTAGQVPTSYQGLKQM
jgi:hypothetical protein